jgi:hypothetical protein
MNVFTFTSDIPLDLCAATKSIRGWMLRREFPTRLVQATEYKIVVALNAPHNGIHNRSVSSLGHILQKQLDHLHSVQSCLIHSANLKESFATATQYQERREYLLIKANHSPKK